MGQKTGRLNDIVEDACKNAGIPTPIEFATQLMAGKDPRNQSMIHEMVLDIQSMGDLPDEAEWAELCEVIEVQYRYRPVTLEISEKANKQLMEYMHSKKKAIELEVNGGIELPPMTQEDMEIYEEWFDENY